MIAVGVCRENIHNKIRHVVEVDKIAYCICAFRTTIRTYVNVELYLESRQGSIVLCSKADKPPYREPVSHNLSLVHPCRTVLYRQSSFLCQCCSNCNMLLTDLVAQSHSKNCPTFDASKRSSNDHVCCG